MISDNDALREDGIEEESMASAALLLLLANDGFFHFASRNFRNVGVENSLDEEDTSLRDRSDDDEDENFRFLVGSGCAVAELHPFMRNGNESSDEMPSITFD